ncbi:hypothetical protein [Olleya sp. 1-3]|uniref:FEKKY domain-containing protein n=1 Tax=Olleya sp. 1-3 TaxID=2058323 RepID=UPI000C33EFFF|nr:hypothetical protein [Olleya sp. 1-3]PKG50944.1 hypothetical protein CXF54_10075 [Olleya sp. 1-3]
MKHLLLSTILLFTITTSSASNKEIVAEVVFENLSDTPFDTGQFIISETNTKVLVTSTDSFNITLPKKGKYNFSFSTYNFISSISYPKKITKNKHVIYIRLIAKNNAFQNKYSLQKNLTNQDKLSDEDIADLIKSGSVNFIANAITNNISEEYIQFKKEYNIGFIIENCAIHPLAFGVAVENNKIISAFLSRIYGENWKNTLKNKPLGVK